MPGSHGATTVAVAMTTAQWTNRITGHADVPPDQLLANPRNFRRHPGPQQDALSGVIGQIGYLDPVIVQAGTDTVIDGHLRVELALRSNQSTIPVTYVDLTDDEAALALATVDPISAMAYHDAEQLDALLREVSTDDAGVQALLDSLAESAVITEGLTDPDDVPAVPAEPVTKPGDLWLLGRHRLLCGDATDSASYDDPVDMVMTSPPYWVGKEYETEKTWGEIQSFISVVSGNLAEKTKETGRIVINTGTVPGARLFPHGKTHVRLLLDEWQRELEHYGWLMRYVRIWSKRGQLALVAPNMDVIDTHWEFIAVFYKPEGFKGQRRVGEPWALDGIWDLHGDMSAEGHTAAFPVEIPERNIRLYTDPGDTVLDPFMGSGSTLIACEQTGRTCFGIDRDPVSIDMAVTRWERFTGQTATLAVAAMAAD